MGDALPATAGDLTPAWLSAALGRHVTHVTARPLLQSRAFSGGTLLRLTLAAEHRPAHLVAKLAPENPAMRTRLGPANAREVAFYRNVAPHTPHVPQAAFAAADTTGSVILLPDLSDHRAYPLVDGASPQVAALALQSLAAIHARWWNAPPMLAADLCTEFGFATHWPAFRAAHPDLPPGLLALGDRLAAGQAPDPDPGPHTLTHADAHLENLLISPTGDAVWLDWQMAGGGMAVADVCYFLTSSLDPALRRAIEGDLIAHWHAALTAHGVTDYPLAQARRDYRHALSGKLILTVIATAGFDNRGPARAAYRRADLARLAAFAADHLDDRGHPQAP
jgi:hypothetical protein